MAKLRRSPGAGTAAPDAALTLTALLAAIDHFAPKHWICPVYLEQRADGDFGTGVTMIFKMMGGSAEGWEKVMTRRIRSDAVYFQRRKRKVRIAWMLHVT